MAYVQTLGGTDTSTKPFATTTDVANYMGVTEANLPPNIPRLISRAGEMMDEVTLGRVVTTDTAHSAAAKNAVCAQVEYWLEIGEEADVIGASNFGSHHMGGVTLNGRMSTLAPRARRHLFNAGLLYRGVGRL